MTFQVFLVQHSVRARGGHVLLLEYQYYHGGGTRRARGTQVRRRRVVPGLCARVGPARSHREHLLRVGRQVATQRDPFSLICQILVVAGKCRRYGMAPAHIPVFVSQKPSTENGQFRVAGTPEISVLSTMCSPHTAAAQWHTHTHASSWFPASACLRLRIQRPKHNKATLI